LRIASAGKVHVQIASVPSLISMSAPLKGEIFAAFSTGTASAIAFLRQKMKMKRL